MKVWTLIGYSWEMGDWTTFDIFATKETAQRDVAEDYGDNYHYDPITDTYYCDNDDFDITKLKIVERTVR